MSVTDQTGEARYPSFKGIMAAKKKPVTTWTLADLGIDAGDGGSGRCVVGRARTPPSDRRGRPVSWSTDEGDGGVKLAEFLATGKFI